MARKITNIKIKLSQLIDLGIYLWLFLLPWQTRLIIKSSELYGDYWEYGTLSIYGTEVLLIVILFLFSVYLVRNQLFKELITDFWGKLLSPKLNLIKLLAILLLWGLIVNSWSQDFYLSLYRLAHLLLALLGIVLIYLRKISWQKIASLLVMAGLVQGWMAIIQFLDQQVISSKWLGIAEQLPGTFGVSVIQAGSIRWLRAYGSLSHPNILGGFLTFTIVFSWQLILKASQTLKIADAETKKRIKLTLFGYYGAVVFIMSGILLSFSRASWLAVFWSSLIMTIYIIYYNKKLVIPFIKILLLMLIPTLIWFTLYPTPFLTRLQGQEVLEQQSLAERKLSYQDSSGLLNNYWLYGSGFGTYTKVLADQNPGRQISLNQPIHNSWLLILSEWGIVGLAILISIFLLTWQKSKNKVWTFIILSNLVILMMFDHWWLSLIFGNIYLFLLLIINFIWPKAMIENT